MHRNGRLITNAVVVCFAILISGCEFERRSNSPTEPTDVIRAFMGNWGSSALVPDPNACGNFQWKATEVNGNTVSGEFQATCPGGVALKGAGTGTTEGNTLRFNASGTATSPDATSCPFSLTGTAELQSDGTIRVTYTGSLCGVSISGTETLRKR